MAIYRKRYMNDTTSYISDTFENILINLEAK